MKPLLIATVGLPRSGKSTILKEMNESIRAPIVSRDAIRMALHGNAYISKAEGMTRAIYGVMISALFIAGHPIVLADETHYSREARRFVECKEWDTVFLEVPTAASECIRRAIVTNQGYLVPVIEEMVERYEPLGPGEVKYHPSHVWERTL